jgi:hypothetical protein
MDGKRLAPTALRVKNNIQLSNIGACALSAYIQAKAHIYQPVLDGIAITALADAQLRIEGQAGGIADAAIIQAQSG